MLESAPHRPRARGGDGESQTKVLWLIAGAGVIVAVAASQLLDTWLDGPTRPDGDGTIEVVVDRYRFEPSEIVIPSGFEEDQFAGVTA